MSRTAPWSTSRGSRNLQLSLCGFTCWWLAILGIHLVTCVYNVVYAKLYWGFDLTLFSVFLEFNKIGMDRQHFHSIAYVYMALATIHGMCAVLMIAGSLWYRKLVFGPRKRNRKSTNVKTKHETFKDVGISASAQPAPPARVVRFLSAAYHRLGSHHGILGVKGEHFHIVLICREIVELSLQTAQAIRMSKYLPRILLNRFYVTLLVINCWSSLFAYSRWFWRDEARRRFAAIVSDCVLNLMTTMGVSLIIMTSYVHEYDFNDFDWRLLDDDAWVSQMLNEARVVLVMSWSDLLTRAFFSLSLVATTADMKELLHSPPGRRNRGTNAVGPNVSVTNNSNGPDGGLIGPESPRNKDKFRLVIRQSSYKSTGFRTRFGRKILQGIHYAFGVWGVVVLVLHVHASMQTPLFECNPKVYPMAGALPSCYTVTFDCYCMGISGLKGEVTSEWDGFDRSTTMKLRILHCPSLEVPTSFQDFSGLEDLLVYNSTILDWNDEAALSNATHPEMKQMIFLRVNMTNGTLPQGFQSFDFPAYLFQIVFSETNLETLPDDLDAKWPASSVIQLENSQLATVPSGLVRLQPYYLALSGNPITSVPSELFEGNIQFIFLGRTKVNKLPGNVTPTSLSVLDITNTNISYFPSWIDPLVEATLDVYPTIVAGESTYCFDLGNITNGVTTGFSATFQSEYSAMLMNASKANWEVLNQAVDCTPPLLKTQFSQDYFDTMYGLRAR